MFSKIKNIDTATWVAMAGTALIVVLLYHYALKDKLSSFSGFSKTEDMI